MVCTGDIDQAVIVAEPPHKLHLVANRYPGLEANVCPFKHEARLVAMGRVTVAMHLTDVATKNVIRRTLLGYDF